MLPAPRALLLAFSIAVMLAAGPRADSPQVSGRALEETIAAVLREHGFAILRGGVAGPRARDRLAWRDVGYTMLDGGRGQVDFVLRTSAFDRPVWVEAMRPRSRGSLAARLACMLRTAAVAFPDVRVVLVLDGGVWRDGVPAWARARAASIRAKPVAVMSPAGFRDWLARRLDGDAAPFGAEAAPGRGYLRDTVRE